MTGSTLNAGQVAKSLSVTLVFSLLLSAPGMGQTSTRLAVKVVDPNGELIAGVKVTITHRSESDYLKTKITDKQGRFHFSVRSPSLFDDCFLLLAEAPGYQAQRSQVLLTPGNSLRTIITLVPENAIEFHNQGLTAVLSRDFSVAEELFLRALSMQRDLTPSRLALAELYLQQKRYDEAISSAQIVLETLPKNYRVLEIIYTAHLALGNMAEAEQAFMAMAEEGAS